MNFDDNDCFLIWGCVVNENMKIKNALADSNVKIKNKEREEYERIVIHLAHIANRINRHFMEKHNEL